MIDVICLLSEFREIELNAKLKIMKKILVPTDFSDTAKGAFYYAAQFAHKTGGAIIKVVHAFMPEIASEYHVLPPIDEYLMGREEQMINFLQEVLANLNGIADKLDYESEILVGFAADEISKKSKDYDLIVMGSTGTGGILGKLFGSVSSSVSQRAHCPVLLVPKAVNFTNIDHILYACSCDDIADDVIDDLKSFNRAFNANIHFIHVKSDKKEDFNKTKAQIFSELFDDGNPSFSFEFSEIEGESVTDSLTDYAEKHNIDLIVMVTQHRSIWQQLFHRSETKRMALGTHYPLLVFHTD